MPWNETSPMTERMRFITLHQEGFYSMSELCQRFGISRQTGYKWLGRFEETGLEGLKEQSRAPHSSPRRTGEAVEAALLAARQAHPRWGPLKLRDYLQPRRPDLVLPAPSTIGKLLKRHGLIPAQARRRRLRHPGSAPLQTAVPNQVWCVDFKGEFPTGDGVDCYPLTVMDAHTRYLLACQARPSTAQAGVFPVFQRLFAEYGLPEAIRTDNGTPFATTALCGLSQLSVWWLKLGITHQRIAPGRPEQNGRHERMHRTLKAETTRPPASDHRRQQERFDAFLQEYNEERPHQALGGKTPASLWTPSARCLPLRVLEHEYPGHYLVRKISQAGNFRFWSQPVFLSRTLTGEQIGLEETGDGIWSVYFRDYLLARFDERVYRIVA